MAEYALLTVFVQGGDYVSDDVVRHVGEETLFESIINRVSLPKTFDDDGIEVKIEFQHDIHVFPTAEARDAALKLARGTIIWLQREGASVSVHLHCLAENELITYRRHH